MQGRSGQWNSVPRSPGLIVGRCRTRFRAPSMRLPTALAPLLALSVSLGALEPLNPPVPLAPPSSAPSPGEAALALVSAQRSQDLGFPSTAAALYRSMLAAPGADSGRLTLALASALLDDGDVAGARQGPRLPPGARLPSPRGA